MAIERQRVIEQDKMQRRHNFDPVESNLTEEQVKVNLFRARQKVKQRFIDIEGYGL